ncbi:hypothetical protein ACFLIM_18935 [Nonomuraea sp. M3C6]|uniref:Uncharacterized protein n=1 Tax=Nonomuraea marmarensis TaxID=3351344 RepID=A0ABW7AD35_9ACTN
MRRHRRPVLTSLAGVCVAVLVAGPAVAAAAPPDPAPGGPQRPYEPDVNGPENIDSLTVSVTREKGTRKGVTVTFDRKSVSASGGVPAGARRFVLLYDPSIRFNPEAFPTCSRDVLVDEGPQACPAASRVGRAAGTQLDGTRLQAIGYNARIAGRPGILLHFPDTGVLLEQTIEQVTAPYRADYRWAIDELIMPNDQPPEERAGTSRFELTFGATRSTAGRTVSFVETTAKPGARLKFGLWSEFVTGQVVLPTAHAVLPAS